MVRLHDCFFVERLHDFFANRLRDFFVERLHDFFAESLRDFCHSLTHSAGMIYFREACVIFCVERLHDFFWRGCVIFIDHSLWLHDFFFC